MEDVRKRKEKANSKKEDDDGEDEDEQKKIRRWGVRCKKMHEDDERLHLLFLSGN